MVIAKKALKFEQHYFHYYNSLFALKKYTNYFVELISMHNTCVCFRLIIHEHRPTFITFYPTPLIYISEVIISDPRNGSKSTHGACPGNEKLKTVHS